ncbi:hypothetical protein EJ07DRAFT_154046 [Lizonia empirigonia]|nr:hypothetical protein EJ07DRAFT_154046 [Lizonia empirigonia]
MSESQPPRLPPNYDLRRSRYPFAVSLTEKPPKSHSFECRPRHGSLDELDDVDLLCSCWSAGLVAFAGASVAASCGARRAGCDCAGSCSGGIIMGDLARFRDVSVRDRLRERSHRRSVMAPKKAREVGDAGADVGDG